MDYYVTLVSKHPINLPQEHLKHIISRSPSQWAFGIPWFKRNNSISLCIIILLLKRVYLGCVTPILLRWSGFYHFIIHFIPPTFHPTETYLLATFYLVINIFSVVSSSCNWISTFMVLKWSFSRHSISQMYAKNVQLTKTIL